MLDRPYYDARTGGLWAGDGQAGLRCAWFLSNVRDGRPFLLDTLEDTHAAHLAASPHDEDWLRKASYL